MSGEEVDEDGMVERRTPLPVREPSQRNACSMTARDLVAACHLAGPAYQLHVNEFVDDFRRASPAERAAMAADGPAVSGRMSRA